YVVFFAYLGEPYLGEFKATVNDPRFQKTYRKLYVLKARNDVEEYEFFVYGLRSMHPGDGPAGTVELGLGAEEFRSLLRV
ncbi:MAG: hypothetical protein V2A74_04785, partial [bacterium]